MCPVGSVCGGGELLPAPTEGKWIHRPYEVGKAQSSNVESIIYLCIRKTCAGAAKEGGLVFEPECWTPQALDAPTSSCSADDLLCTRGAHGRLCGSCLDGFEFSSMSQQCESCPSNLWVYPTIFLAVGVAVAVLASLVYTGTLVIPPIIRESSLFGLFRVADAGSVKVLFSTYQVSLQ